MTAGRAIAIDELPDSLPVFPLTGALLLPGGRLPLNIFEPRYLNMVEDALGRPGRLIGMVQPLVDEAGMVPEGAAIYDTGCAGRITQFSETGDGRYLITLSGIARFRVVDELEMQRGYRRVQADFSDFAGDLEEDAGTLDDRDALLGLLRAFFQVKGIEAEWPAIEEADDGFLVTSLAMVCPFEAPEKQALLECTGTAARGALLAALMEMSLHGATGDDDDAPAAARH